METEGDVNKTNSMDTIRGRKIKRKEIKAQKKFANERKCSFLDLSSDAVSIIMRRGQKHIF